MALTTQLDLLRRKYLWNFVKIEHDKNLVIGYVVNYEENLRCRNCERLMPNKKHRTKNGCKWCNTKGKK